MPDINENHQAEQAPGYTPASFEKRTAAWMGIAYVLMVLFVINFSIFTGGRELPGTFPLFLLPAAAGTAAVTVHRMRAQALPAAVRAGCVMMLLLCAAALLLGLALGVPALIAAFGG